MKDLKRFEIIYSDEAKGLNFSALKMWKRIYEKEKTPFVKLRYANQLSVCGYYSKAKDLFAQTELKSTHKEIWYLKYQYMGNHFIRLGEIKKAQLNYIKSLRYRNDSTVPYILVANTFQIEQNYEKAIEFLNLALAKEGDIDEVYYNLATASVQYSNIKQALNYVEESLKIDSNYMLARKLKEDINSYMSIKEIDKYSLEKMNIKMLIQTAENYESNELHYSSLKLWKPILEKEPNEYRKLRYADQLRLCGYLNEAESTFLEINIKKIPKNQRYTYYTYLSQLYYDKYNWRKAELVLKKCFRYANINIDVYIEYTKFLFKKGKHYDVIAFLTSALEKFSANKEIYYNISVSAMIINKIDIALKYVNLCLEMDSKCPNAVTLKEDILKVFALNGE